MLRYPSLNLPETPLEIVMEDNVLTVFDPLRRKSVALTPEEWVRQNFVAFLKDKLGYPAGLMANEVAIKLNSTSRRCDTVVYSRCGLKPLMVIEYKAPHVKISGAVFDQIARYNMVVGAPWLVVSNGMHHYCCRFDRDGGYAFVREIPRYESL